MSSRVYGVVSEPACDYLARVGLSALTAELDEIPPAEEAPERMHVAWRRRVNRHARARLLQPCGTGHRDSARWIVPITWPERVPGLKAWGGQQTLPKLIEQLQDSLRSVAGAVPVLDARAPLSWSSGFDPLSCVTGRDVGFSVRRQGLEIVHRVGVELLAIYGLETLPLVSFGARECGFLHRGRVWRFSLEPRDTDYYHCWGYLRSGESS